MKKGKDGKPTTEEISDGPRPYSVFNKYSLMNYKGVITQSPKDTGGIALKDYNIISEEELINPTATKIIQITSEMGDDNLGL